MGYVPYQDYPHKRDIIKKVSLPFTSLGMGPSIDLSFSRGLNAAGAKASFFRSCLYLSKVRMILASYIGALFGHT